MRNLIGLVLILIAVPICGEVNCIVVRRDGGSGGGGGGGTIYYNEYVFDDASRITVTHDSTIDAGTDLTVGCFVETTDTDPFSGILDKGWPAMPGPYGGWVLDIQAGAMRFSTQSSTASYFAVSGSYTFDGSCQHVVGVHDSSNSQNRIYIGGTLANTIYQASYTATGIDLNIGGDDASTWMVTANLSDCRIYTRVLSDAEIATWAAYGSVDSTSLGLWFNGSEGTPGNAVVSATDQSGNGNDGTPGGDPQYATGDCAGY